VDDGSTVVLLAASRRGYGNLCKLVTQGRRRSEKGESRVGWREVFDHAEDLIALWGGDRSLLGGEADPFFVAHALHEAFGDRLYALAARHRRAEEVRHEARLRVRRSACASRSSRGTRSSITSRPGGTCRTSSPRSGTGAGWWTRGGC